MKQTSVEWLYSKLWNTTKDKFTWYAILEQAKEMEKQQITDAHSYGQYYCNGCDESSAEQYYNETYGSNGSDDSPKVENKDSFGEISDKEIEKASYTFWEFKEHTASSAWKLGAKWYREQLKQRQ